ncbi:MAG TPA: cupredoxin family copper-binding protein [Dongiaceae bacterium]|nr:cupredoxin family copper-binding protein [Dongiaceae bacterium]
MTDLHGTEGRRGILRRLLALTLLPLAPDAMAQEPASATVEMTKFAFAPAEIEIKAGRSITFINHDLVPHTATAGDKSFDTGTVRGGESKEIVFPTAGQFPYVCRFHPHMTGMVRVT